MYEYYFAVTGISECLCMSSRLGEMVCINCFCTWKRKKRILCYEVNEGFSADGRIWTVVAGQMKTHMHKLYKEKIETAVWRVGRKRCVTLIMRYKESKLEGILVRQT